MIKMKSLVIIPAYTEEKTIRTVINECKKLKSYVLVIDDGSIDGTYEIIKKLNIGIIKNKKNKGKGYSLRKGFDYAIRNNYDIVITMDADGEIIPSEIPKLVNNLKKDVDIVVGRRKVYRSVIRKLLNQFVLFWINYATGYKLNDPYSGLRTFKVSALKKMNLCSDRFEIEPEIILEASKNKFRLEEVEIECGKFSHSKLNFYDHILINNFFDKWVLNNINYLDISSYKKIFLLLSCNFGYMVGRIFEKLIKLNYKKI